MRLLEGRRREKRATQTRSARIQDFAGSPHPPRFLLPQPTHFAHGISLPGKYCLSSAHFDRLPLPGAELERGIFRLQHSKTANCSFTLITQVGSERESVGVVD